jgi:hypothetical protein
MQGKEGFSVGRFSAIPRTPRPNETVINRMFPGEAGENGILASL